MIRDKKILFAIFLLVFSWILILPFGSFLIDPFLLIWLGAVIVYVTVRFLYKKFPFKGWIILLSFIIRRRITTIPKGVQNYAEVLLEGVFNLADSVTGSRQKTMKFLPLVLPLFFFILLNNIVPCKYM